jgi:hypothetical protein
MISSLEKPPWNLQSGYSPPKEKGKELRSKYENLKMILKKSKNFAIRTQQNYDLDRTTKSSI